MDFTINDEQRAAIDMAHDFSLNELRPLAAEWDQKGEFPIDLILKKAGQAGLTCATIPEEFGGGGLDPLTGAFVFEEMAWGCAGLATSLGANNLACGPIIIGATQEQKERWLPLLCDPDDPKLAAFALTEPEAGSDVAGIKTTAKKDGDNWIINGQKCFITNGGISDVYTVFAQTGEGLAGFIVDGNTEGITMGRHEDKLGIRASHTAEVFFENVIAKEEDRMPGNAFRTVMMTLDQTRAGVAALAIGVARAAFEEANAYAKERVQFGKPIIANQAVGFMLADMVIKIEAGRKLYCYAAWLANEMAETGKAPADLPWISSAAKAFCSDVAMEVTTDAVQVMGGYGYMKDYPAEKYMRDAKIMQIYEGTSQIQRVVMMGNLMKIKELRQY